MTFIDRAINFFKGSTATSVMGVAFKGSSMSSSGSGLTFQQAVSKGYKNLVWVHRCAASLGEAIGSVPWRAYQIQKSGALRPTPGHPLENLIEFPNKHYGRKELMESMSIYLTLSGNSFWEIVMVQGKPSNLFTLRPDWMFPIPDPIEYIRGYKMDASAGEGSKAMFEPNEILHIKYMDPLNEFVGMSPLAAAARTMATEDSAIRWNKSIFDNSAVPNGILKVPAASIQKKDRDKMREELEKEFTQENMHRPMVLWGGMDWQKMALDTKDLDFLNQRKLNKYEICAICQTPPQIVGANEDPTYANYDVARTAYWEDTISPKLGWIANSINRHISPAFGANMRVLPDVSDVPALRVSYASKVETAKNLWFMGYPINAINRRCGLGFDDVPWGDVWWAQLNMMPVSDASSPLIDQNQNVADLEGDQEEL